MGLQLLQSNLRGSRCILCRLQQSQNQKQSRQRKIYVVRGVLEPELQILTNQVEQTQQQAQLVSFVPTAAPVVPLPPFQHQLVQTLVTPEHVLVQWSQAPHLFTALNEAVYDYLALSSVPILIYFFLKGTLFPFLEEIEKKQAEQKSLPQYGQFRQLDDYDDYRYQNNNNNFNDSNQTESSPGEAISKLAVQCTNRIVQYTQQARLSCRQQLKLRQFNNDHIGSFEWDQIKSKILLSIIPQQNQTENINYDDNNIVNIGGNRKSNSNNGCGVDWLYSNVGINDGVGFRTWREIRDLEDCAICESLVSMLVQSIVLREIKYLFQRIDSYYFVQGYDKPAVL